MSSGTLLIALRRDASQLPKVLHLKWVRLVMELTLAMLSTEYQLCVGLLDRKKNDDWTGRLSRSGAEKWLLVVNSSGQLALFVNLLLLC